jgi:hypothetical protein
MASYNIISELVYLMYRSYIYIVSSHPHCILDLLFSSENLKKQKQVQLLIFRSLKLSSESRTCPSHPWHRVCFEVKMPTLYRSYGDFPAFLWRKTPGAPLCIISGTGVCE